MTAVPDDALAEQAFELMKELITLAGEKWISASRVTSLADRRALTDPSARVVFLTGVKNLLREIPVKVFPDADTRQALLQAAQDALDLAIDAEEDHAEGRG